MRAGAIVAALVLTALAVSHAVPFWWGLPTQGQISWAFDEIPPEHSGDEVLQRHGGRYPPLHYKLLKAAYAPVRAVEALGWADFTPAEKKTWLRASGRLLSVVMALATMLLLARFARGFAPELGGRRRWLLPWLVGLSPVYVFYAKTVNLDVPYLFWFAASLVIYQRLLERHELRDYLAYGLLAAGAICTKDQAFALYVLPSMWLPFALARFRGESWRAAPRALFDRRLLAGAGLGLLVFLMVHRVFVDPNDLREHLRVMLGKGSQPNQNFFAPTLGGQLAMAGLAVRHLAFLLGLPAFLAALYGVVTAWREGRRRALVFLLFPLSLYLFFVMPILFHRDRYLLPAAMLLAAFAAVGLVRLAGRGSRSRRVLVALILAHVLLRGWWINLSMLNDGRYAAEAWIDARRTAGASVVLLNTHPPRAPRSPGRIRFDRFQRRGVNVLRRLQPDFILIAPAEAADRDALEVLESLHQGRLGYEFDRAFQWCADWNPFAVWKIHSNLSKINERWLAFRRHPAVLEAGEARAWLDDLWTERRQDWSEFGRRLAASPLLADRRRLTPDILAYNLAPNDWTRGPQPALLVFTNSTAEAQPARVALRRPGDAGPTPIRVRGETEARDLVLDRPRRSVRFGLLQPGESLTVGVGVAPGGGQIAVKVLPIQPSPAAP